MTEIDSIQLHRSKLEELCRKHRVKTLEVFGSAAEGSFDPDRSDLDFLVDFFAPPPEQIAPNYFGLLHDLEDLFQRRIDLVMDRAIRNPYFRQGVDRSRRKIYGT